MLICVKGNTTWALDHEILLKAKWTFIVYHLHNNSFICAYLLFQNTVYRTNICIFVLCGVYGMFYVTDDFTLFMSDI